MRLFTLLILLVPGLALAANSANYNFEISGLAGSTVGGDVHPLVDGVDASVDNGGAYALIVDLREGRKRDALLQYELFVGELNSEVKLSGDTTGEYDLRARYFHFGGTYEFNQSDLRPYVAATIGLTNLDSESTGSQNDWSMGFGAGMKWFPLTWFGLRLDARAFGTFHDGTTNIVCDGGCSAGLTGDMWWQSMVSGGVSVRF